MLFSRICCDRNGFKLKEGIFRLDIRTKVFFYGKGHEVCEQVVWNSGGCPVPGDVQGQAGPGSEQPDLSVDVHCRGVGLGDLYRSLSTQTILQLYEKKI